MTQNKIIPENMYKNLAQNVNLNHFLRSLFDTVDTVEKFNYLLEQAENILDAFYKLQPTMTQSVYENLLVNLPIRFIRDSHSRRGATYLRWRNLGNNRTGKYAWKDIVTDPNQPQELKDSLLQIEKERIVLNMHIAIIVHILRQLDECREKIRLVEQLS